MKFLKFFLIFIPISIILELFKADAVLNFVFSSLAIIPLAGLMGEATEQISVYSGPKMGGFLNAAFGNATELIISFFALKRGLIDVVKASIVGSVIGNVLLVLGFSMLLGGARYKIQKFNKKTTEVSSSMLLFAVIGLCIPALFTHTISKNLLTYKYEWLSLVVAGIMFFIYLLSLYFSFYTHKDLYVLEYEEEKNEKWSLRKALTVLLISTIIVALESEILVGSVDSMAKTLKISETFIGIIIIPIIGNAAEHSTAAVMAIKNKMDLSIEIAIGSSLQIILFVAPVLVFLSLLFTPMSIILNEFELAALIASALIVNRAASDGESNWLEGVQLIAVYLIIAVSFLI